MRIVFFGTSSFAAQIFSELIKKEQKIIAVVTREDQFKGRHLQLSPPPVKELVSKLTPSIPIFQPKKASDPAFTDEYLRPLNPDLFVVVAYGEIIKQNLLSLPKLGCINIHASLLPKYRGAAPIQRCLMAGDTKTGISIIEMALQMDAGDILAIKEVPIPFEMTFGELEPILCHLGAELVLEVIERYKNGIIIKTPQNESSVTFAPKITTFDEQINWNRSAIDIHNQIRALSPLPGAWSYVDISGEKKRLKIKKAHVCHEQGTLDTFLKLDKNRWIVPCKEGTLEILEVQLEGKKVLPTSVFLKGLKQPAFFYKN